MRRNKNTRRTAANSTTGKRRTTAPHTKQSVTEYRKACNYIVLVFMAAFAVMSWGAVFWGW